MAPCVGLYYRPLDCTNTDMYSLGMFDTLCGATCRTLFVLWCIRFAFCYVSVGHEIRALFTVYFILYIVAGVNWESMSSVYPKFIDL